MWLGSNTNILFLSDATSEVEYICDHFSKSDAFLTIWNENREP